MSDFRDDDDQQCVDEEHEQELENGLNEVKTDDDAPKEGESLDLKEKSTGNKKANRFHPYSKTTGTGDKRTGRNRVFISNIPYETKWQTIKDLMREKVGEVTYVELYKDAEGKSRGCGVVEFKDDETMKKAVELMAKYDLGGRPLNIREDPDGENARRFLQRAGGGMPFSGGSLPDMGPHMMNLPPALANHPKIAPDIISALQSGRLGSSVFVANLDFKVNWKKLKEVFSMAGTVKRADIKEDKDGKSRGIATVTFEQPIEAVQAISMFNGQLLFDRPMNVKMDEKSLPHDDFRALENKAAQLPRGLGGVGMGLGPGGQPLTAGHVAVGSGMGGAVGPAGLGMDAASLARMGAGAAAGFRGMDGIGMGMGGFGSTMGTMAGTGMGAGFGSSMVGSGMGMTGFGMGAAMGGVNSMAMGMGMGMGMGSNFSRTMDMDRGISSGFGTTQTSTTRAGNKGCQIFARNLPFDLTWQKLKEKFSQCGHVLYAEIKMENGKSKGCGTVRFDSPETAEKACRLMNGSQIGGREIDVRMDRNQ